MASSALDRALALATAAARHLALPLSLLLFLQWPLRDLVRSYSREANDLGQWIFALYVAASVTAATDKMATTSHGSATRRRPIQ